MHARRRRAALARALHHLLELPRRKVTAAPPSSPRRACPKSPTTRASLSIDREGRVITAEYDDFHLVNVYTPNSSANSNAPYRQQPGRRVPQTPQETGKTKPPSSSAATSTWRTLRLISRTRNQHVRNHGFTIRGTQRFPAFINVVVLTPSANSEKGGDIFVVEPDGWRPQPERRLAHRLLPQRRPRSRLDESPHPPARPGFRTTARGDRTHLSPSRRREEADRDESRQGLTMIRRDSAARKLHVGILIPLTPVQFLAMKLPTTLTSSY